MIWQNPWALLGLGAIAIPILIHLLGRDKAPRYAFPSLRFIEIAELPPTRRTRLHDLLLLATRVAIFAFAAVALAQPLLLFASRRPAIDSRLARAIIVDTSASMLRLTVGGRRAVDSARSEAKRLESGAQTSISIETNNAGAAISGAIGWLESQASRRELVVVSDFQTGAIDSATVAGIPLGIGIHALPIATQPGSAQLERRSLVRDASVVARIDVTTDPTTVSWVRADSVAGTMPRIAIDAHDRTSADAVAAAARTVAVSSPIDTSSLITVVFAGAADRDALSKRSIRVSSPHLLGVVAQLGLDSVSVAEDTATHRLLLFSNDSAATVRSAMLLGGIRSALSIAPSAGELDPSTIAAPVIGSWQRPPSAKPTRETVDSASGPSDARWMWMLVLVLIAIETWLRRERSADAVRVEERAHDRAA